MNTSMKLDQKPSAKKPRTLNLKKLTRIRKWVQEIQREMICGAKSHGDVVSLALDATPSKKLYGRYATPQESSPIIAEAARFISSMSIPIQQLNANQPSKFSGDFHKRLCQRLQSKVNHNEADFFECVALILRERGSGKDPAQIDPRKMRKFGAISRKRGRPLFQENTQRVAMEYATFRVLSLRCAQPGEPNPATTKAVTRSEIKQALIDALDQEDVRVNSLSEIDLSECLNQTSSGRFLKPFMAEKPIATRKSKKLQI
jgi:hypothetical protein